MSTRKRTSILPVLVAGLTLGLSGAVAGCVSVEADAPDVRITQHGIMFDGMAAGGDSMIKSYSQQHPKLDIPAGIDSELKPVAATLVARNGVFDLSFIRSLSLSMTVDGTSAPVALGSYEPAAGAPAGDQISLTTVNPVNILEAWKTDSATFTLQIVGQLPTNDWAGDVSLDLSVSAKATYTY